MLKLAAQALAKKRAALKAGQLVATTAVVGVVHSISAAIKNRDTIEARKKLKAASKVINRVAALMMQRKRGEVSPEDAGPLADAVGAAAKAGLLSVLTSTAWALFTAFARATSLVVGSVFRIFAKATMLVIRLAAANPIVAGSLAVFGASLLAYKLYSTHREKKFVDREEAPTYIQLPPPSKSDDKTKSKIFQYKADDPVHKIIAEAAIRHKVPVDFAIRLAGAESTFRVNAANNRSTAKGLFQFTDDTWKDMGGKPGMEFDAHENAELGARYIKQHYERLKKVLTRPVLLSDIYTLHFLGPGAIRMVAKADNSWPLVQGLELIGGPRYARNVLASNPNIKDNARTVGEFYAIMGAKVGMDEYKEGALGGTYISSPTPISAAPFPPGPTGRFMLPTSGRFSSGYGKRMHPTKKVELMHYGIDIAAPLGTPIYAADGGVVTKASVLSFGYGTLIVIDHGSGLQTKYGHSRRLFVSKGQAVAKGQKIAEVGSEGRSTGPHLHFEILSGGSSVDPAKFLPSLPAQAGRDAFISEQAVVASVNLMPEFVKGKDGKLINLN
jgi:murein DD-endopeptidase MepM/ murein hydrolase activator NlpD